jgi:hypothetical protein
MSDLILFKRSSTPGAIPAAGQLTTGEMAVNTADGKLFTKKSNGTVVEIGAGGGGGGGVTDHGALTGLGDDDHTQYHNDARGDARYSQLGHTHAASDIVSGSLDIARIPTGTTSSTVCIGDDSRLSDARTPTAHTHAASDVTSGTFGIAQIPTGTTSSTVCIGDDSRLSDARTPTAHTHSLSDLTQSGATDGQVATWNNSASQWEPQTPSGGGGSGPAVPFVVPASGEYIASIAASASYTTLAQTANRMYLNPFIASKTFSASALGVYVTTSASSSNARVCVYASDASGRPTGSPLVSTGNLACTSTGMKEDVAGAYTFTAGTQYWLGVHSSSTQTLRAFTSASAWELLAVPTGTTGVVGYYMSATFSSGAPTIGTLTNNTGNSPFAFLKGS